MAAEASLSWVADAAKTEEVLHKKMKIDELDVLEERIVSYYDAIEKEVRHPPHHSGPVHRENAARGRAARSAVVSLMPAIVGAGTSVLRSVFGWAIWGYMPVVEVVLCSRALVERIEGVVSS